MSVKVIGFRATDIERQKLEAMAAATGLTVSEAIRALVRQAEVRPAIQLRSDTVITAKSSSGGELSEGTPAAVVSE